MDILLIGGGSGSAPAVSLADSVVPFHLELGLGFQARIDGTIFVLPVALSPGEPSPEAYSMKRKVV